MAKWTPDSEQVEEVECIGRRLFNLTDIQRPYDSSGNPTLLVTDFFDTRLETDLSVERLGNPNPSEVVLKHLSTLADEECSRWRKCREFIGWSCLLARDIRFRGWQGQISPQPVGEGSSENVYHAEISRDGWRDKATSYALAATLMQEFSAKARFEPSRT